MLDNARHAEAMAADLSYVLNNATITCQPSYGITRPLFVCGVRKTTNEIVIFLTEGRADRSHYGKTPPSYEVVVFQTEQYEDGTIQLSLDGRRLMFSEGLAIVKDTVEFDVQIGRP